MPKLLRLGSGRNNGVSSLNSRASAEVVVGQVRVRILKLYGLGRDAAAPVPAVGSTAAVAKASAFAPSPSAASQLPPEVVEEILRRYADVLRVGKLEVNGEVVSWRTDTSTEFQLRNFCSAFFRRLRQLPELVAVKDDVLRNASYWLCKAVSINYSLMEVLLLVQQRVGVMCTIETRDIDGGLITYSVEARSTQTMCIRLIWRGKNNIVYRDPATSKRQVKGTIFSLETEFGLPPACKHVPAYRLQMRFKRSLAARVAAAVVCRTRKAAVVEKIIPQEPMGAGSMEAGSSSERPAEEAPLEMPLRVVGGAPTAPAVDPTEDLFVYYQCFAAGRTERSIAAQVTAGVDWHEVWEFPVRTSDFRSDVIVSVFEAVGRKRPRRSQLLGRVRVPLSEALGSSYRAIRPLDGAVGGSLEMELEFLPCMAPSQVLSPAATTPQPGSGTSSPRGGQSSSSSEEECELAAVGAQQHLEAEGQGGGGPVTVLERAPFLNL